MNIDPDFKQNFKDSLIVMSAITGFVLLFFAIFGLLLFPGYLYSIGLISFATCIIMIGILFFLIIFCAVSMVNKQFKSEKTNETKNS